MHIYIYRIPELLPDIEKKIKKLPQNLIKRILRRKNAQKQTISFLSYLLLQKVMKEEFQSSLEGIKFLASGKPVLDNTNHHFNISHTANIIGIAITTKGAIGIDIQEHREFEKLEASFTFFSKVEQKAILAAELPKRKLVELWSKKEAFVKAVGGQMFEMSAQADISSSSSIWSERPYFFYPLNLEFNGYAWLVSSFPVNSISTTNKETIF